MKSILSQHKQFNKLLTSSNIGLAEVPEAAAVVDTLRTTSPFRGVSAGEPEVGLENLTTSENNKYYLLVVILNSQDP